MIVYDLSCSQGHRFEGWFGSSADFAEQRESGLLTCPECGCETIGKAPMAPAVPAKGNRAPTEQSQPQGDSVGGELPAAVREAMTALASAQAKAMKDSEYVGDKFADESRAIHYGEKKARIIHGKASAKESRDLLDEGIAVAPLLVPFTPPDEVN